MSSLVKSKQRVREYGEVFTSKREVDAMFNLIGHEINRIESRILEPACGTGNFLIEALRIKLNVVEARYQKNKIEYEHYVITAISSLYGIDILEDNVRYCRERLYDYFDESYTSLYREQCSQGFRNSINFILSKNILWGDTLAMKMINEDKNPIILSEWSSAIGNMIKRKDYLFADLSESTLPLKPIMDFPARHFLELYLDA